MSGQQGAVRSALPCVGQPASRVAVLVEARAGSRTCRQAPHPALRAAAASRSDATISARPATAVAKAGSRAQRARAVGAADVLGGQGGKLSILPCLQKHGCATVCNNSMGTVVCNADELSVQLNPQASGNSRRAHGPRKQGSTALSRTPPPGIDCALLLMSKLLISWPAISPSWRVCSFRPTIWVGQ